MNRDIKTGKFSNNENVWNTNNGLHACFLDGEMLFFTDDERVKDYTWGKYANGYAAAFIGGDIVPAHRFIAGASKGEVVDHINRIKHDNRRCNLRTTDKSMNAYNTGLFSHNSSGVKGVSFRKDTMKWSARIMKNQKTIYLGCYDTIEEAAAAREGAERVIYADKQ